MTARKSPKRQRAKPTTRRPATDAKPQAGAGETPAAREEALQGPPPREALLQRSDAEREAERERELFTSTSPELAGGDVDADWKRAGSVGEEAPGGSVATPDQDIVDEIGKAVGVPRAPDEPIRSSQEILENRDRHRWEQEQ